MFQLTKEEEESIGFQVGSGVKKSDGTRPYAFTALGVTMLASVLNSDRAVRMSMVIVRDVPGVLDAFYQ